MIVNSSIRMSVPSNTSDLSVGITYCRYKWWLSWRPSVQNKRRNKLECVPGNQCLPLLRTILWLWDAGYCWTRGMSGIQWLRKQNGDNVVKQCSPAMLSPMMIIDGHLRPQVRVEPGPICKEKTKQQKCVRFTSIAPTAAPTPTKQKRPSFPLTKKKKKRRNRCA